MAQKVFVWFLRHYILSILMLMFGFVVLKWVMFLPTWYLTSSFPDRKPFLMEIGKLLQEGRTVYGPGFDEY
ncbi:MAG: hypothetical protein HQL56_16515 [Magnetococcales bacterium]|nr:hypothetical protein [Magnetococcales bacterium]